MKLKEIIKHIKKDKSDYVELEQISKEFNIHEYLDDSDNGNRLQSYFISKWMCTDTIVGTRAYFLNDEFVCVSYQPARKSSEIFEWFSHEAFKKVKEFLYSLKDNPGVLECSLVDMDRNFDDGYHVEFASQILDKEVIYKPTGQKALITKRGSEDDKYRISKELTIKFEDGTTKIVDTFDVAIPYNVGKEAYRISKIEKITDASD